MEGTRNLVRRPAVVGVAAFAWIVAVAAAVQAWAVRDSARGDDEATPVVWPSASALEPSRERPTLLVFVHPLCPCTEASLEELSRILALCDGTVAPTILLVRPAGAPADWCSGRTCSHAREIPNVRVAVDELGREARLFGARTSGQTLLYDARGGLLFSGGITGSRGEAGDNLGASAVVALVTGRATGRATSPVFGCSLLGEMTAGEEGGR